jgi:hypothetical protein
MVTLGTAAETVTVTDVVMLLGTVVGVKAARALVGTTVLVRGPAVVVGVTVELIPAVIVKGIDSTDAQLCRRRVKGITCSATGAAFEKFRLVSSSITPPIL